MRRPTHFGWLQPVVVECEWADCSGWVAGALVRVAGRGQIWTGAAVKYRYDVDMMWNLNKGKKECHVLNLGRICVVRWLVGAEVRFKRRHPAPSGVNGAGGHLQLVQWSDKTVRAPAALS